MTDHSNLLTPSGLAYIAAFKAMGKPGQIETDARVRLMPRGSIGFDVTIESTVLFKYDAVVPSGDGKYHIIPKAWDWHTLMILNHLDKLPNVRVAALALDTYAEGRHALALKILGNPSPALALDAAEAAGAKHYAGG